MSCGQQCRGLDRNVGQLFPARQRVSRWRTVEILTGGRGWLSGFRWTLGPAFAIRKDLSASRFGMGLGATRIGEPTRRDRLLLINAFAMVLLTMLGAAGESLGMDRLLKSNTSKIRTHSLFRQGCMLYELIPTMPDQRLFPLMARFAETVSKCRSFSGLFEVI